MRPLQYVLETILAAFLAAFLLSQVSFAKSKEPPCTPIDYAVLAGTLRHTCDNKFFVNGQPLFKWLDDWWKHRMDKVNPSDPKVLEDVFDNVRFLDKRWKDQHKKGK